MRRMTRLLCLMLLFSLITFSCPLAEGTTAPTGTPAPTPMLTAVPESALAPFNVVLPEDAHVEMAEGRITLVRGDSRVVAMVISRVPDEDPAAALPILMQDFDPKTSETMDFRRRGERRLWRRRGQDYADGAGRFRRTADSIGV